MTPLRRALLLCAAGGVTLGACSPPRSLPLLAYVVAPLWMLAVEALVEAPPRRGRALLAGLVAGTSVNVVALYWVIGLLEEFARFPLVAALPVGALLWLAQGAPFAIAIVCATALGRRGAPAHLALPACLTVACAVTPALFPWHAAASQIDVVPWVQAAELGGEPLLDWLLFTAGAALVQGVRARALGPLALGLAAIVAPFAYGAMRLPAVRAERLRGEAVRVGVVQPNIGIHDKHDPGLWMEHLAILQDQTRELERAGADVVAWPETAYPFPFPRAAVRDVDDPVAVLGRGARGPVLVGAVMRRSILERWNSAIGIERDGRVSGVYDKVELLAFGEFVPFWHWLPPLQARFRTPGLTAGEDVRLVPLAGRRYGVLVCYEDILPRVARRVARLDPDLLVNVTNDAWFGDTVEPHQHHALARLRAIETRRDLVRAVNTGVSGHTLATGEDAVRTRTFVRTGFIAEARVMHGTTLFVRLGDWATPLLLGSLLGAALALRRRPAAATRAW